MSNGEASTHYSANELAGIPGMPKTAKGVLDQARRESWPSQKRSGRGGGREYPLSALPIQTRTFLLNQIVAQLPAPEPALPALATTGAVALVQKAELPALTQLKKWQRETMDARVFFMRLIEQAQAAGISVKKAMATIADQAAAGTLTEPAARLIPLANAKKGSDRTLSVGGMKKWWSAWVNSGKNPAALAPKDVEKIPQGKLLDFARDYQPGKANLVAIPAGIPAWLPYILDEYRRPTKPSMAQALRDLRRRAPAALEIPSYDQVDRLFKRLPAIYLEKGRMTGAEYKAILGYAERDASEYYPMTVCQIDGHSFKAYVAHPTTGAHFHPEVCAVICLTTKAMVGWSAGLAESWRTVSDAFRHACTVTDEKPVGGVPAIVEGDRGAGNLAGINADEFLGIFSRVGSTFIAPEKGGNPQQRGGIERSNQSLWIRAAKDLATYTGKDMDRGARKRVYLKLEKDFKAVKAAGKLGQVDKTSELLMSWREFLEYVEVWVDQYNNTPHSALPKVTAPPPGEPAGKPVRRHMTPYEAWATAVKDGWQPVRYEGDMLAHLMMPHERVKVNRCKFTLHTNQYHAYELTRWHGEEVIAAYDIHDAGQVWVLDLDERPICTARWNGNKRHPHPITVVEKAILDRETRRAVNVEKKAELIRAESDTQRKTLEVVAVREVPKDVIVFEERQRQKETEKERGGRKLFRDSHELAADIERRQKGGEPVGDYETRWLVDYQKSAYAPRRTGLYLADPECAGRFQEDQAQAQ